MFIFSGNKKIELQQPYSPIYVQIQSHHLWLHSYGDKFDLHAGLQGRQWAVTK